MADDKMSMLEEDEPKIKVEELYIIVEMIDSKNRRISQYCTKK